MAQRKLKLLLDPKARHSYICEFHKSVIQTVRQKRQRQDSEESLEADSVEDPVDFFHLQMNTLRRYKKHFKVSINPECPKKLVKHKSHIRKGYSDFGHPVYFI